MSFPTSPINGQNYGIYTYSTNGYWNFRDKSIKPSNSLVLYDYTTGQNSWGLVATTLITTTGVMRITSTSIDSNITKTTSFLGYTYRYLIFRIRRISGDIGVHQIFYSTSSHGASESYSSKITGSTDNEWHTVAYDMWNPNFGGSDWKNNIITNLRFDYCRSTACTLDIDYIVVSSTL